MPRLALVILCCGLCCALATRARAQPQPEEDPPCDPTKRDCGCEQDWGCWELVYSTRGTVLGIKGSTSYAQGGGGQQGSLLTAYSTEHYGTRKGLSGHVLGFGSIGGGSAGNEGSLGGGIDFGYRAPLDPHSGPVLRAGSNAMLLANRELRLSVLEPAQARLGYQFLDGDALFEWAFTAGYVWFGRLAVDHVRRRGLGDSAEIGGYLAMHVRDFRVDLSLIRLPAPGDRPGTPVDLLRASVCAYPRPVAVCADLLSFNGRAMLVQGGARATQAVMAGLTIGLTP